jgi:hypothetical protein
MVTTRQVKPVPLTPMPFGRLLIRRSLADVAAYMKCWPQKVPTATSGNSAIDDDPAGCERVDQIAGVRCTDGHRELRMRHWPGEGPAVADERSGDRRRVETHGGRGPRARRQ